MSFKSSLQWFKKCRMLFRLKMSTQKQEKFRILQKHLVNTKQKTLAHNQESDTASSKE